MKLRKWVIPLLFLSASVVSGCGPTSNTAAQPEEKGFESASGKAGRNKTGRGKVRERGTG